MAIRKEQWLARNQALDTDGAISTGQKLGEQISPTPVTIHSLNEKATTRTRQQWLETHPDAERTLVQCDECQEKLRALSWITDNPHGFGYFQPVYEECADHPELFAHWVADLTRNMNHLHQRG